MMLHRLRLFVVLVCVTVLAGFYFAHVFLRPEAPSMPAVAFYLHSLVPWIIGACLGWWFELFFIPGRWGAPIRRLRLLPAILVQALALSGVVVLARLLDRLILHGELDLHMFADPMLYRALGFVFLVIAVLHVVSEVVRIIGGRILINFILGRYHCPVREERVFMFLDLAGSTALTERLGDVGVQTLITRFFFDITGPIVEFGGEIHRYVGDQVVVTWPMRNGAVVLQAIRCYFAIVEEVRKRAADYEKRFGVAPAFWVGLHGGPVVVSECGDVKQEIVFFGDTVNTTARIEQHCKVIDCPFLISGDLLARVDLPADLRAEGKGFVRLRGREAQTELFTVLPREAA